MIHPRRLLPLLLLAANLAAGSQDAVQLELHCRLDAERKQLTLEVRCSEAGSHVTVLASSEDRLLPAQGVMPAVLASDLVVAAGVARAGQFRASLPVGDLGPRAGDLFLQAVVTTPAGALHASAVSKLRPASAHDDCGVRLRKGAVVYSGHPCNSTKPGAFDFERVRNALPEWYQIVAEDVQPGSARHQILLRTMHERLLALCAKVARQQGCDLVVRAADLADPRTQPVVDLTDALIELARADGR